MCQYGEWRNSIGRKVEILQEKMGSPLLLRTFCHAKVLLFTPFWGQNWAVQISAPRLQKADIRALQKQILAVQCQAERQIPSNALWKGSRHFNLCVCNSSLSAGAKSALLRLADRAEHMQCLCSALKMRTLTNLGAELGLACSEH